MANYDQVVMRWRDRIMGRTNKPNLSNSRMPARGDRIFSYGEHFELARIIRDRKGEPSHWLLNGDRWPGQVTTRQQGIVRGALERSGLPQVIIPHAALSACGIDFDTVQIVDVQRDWNETGTISQKEWPQGAEWEYDEVTLEGTGGYWEGLERAKWGHDPDHPNAEYVPYIGKNTGRKSIMQRNREWYMADDGEGGIEYRHDWFRHFLGGSVIRAKVNYTVMVACSECGGTQKVEPRQSWQGEWFDHCSNCRQWRTGKVPNRRQRWAYFLSGFDENETRPSYFLCELPPKARPTTYAEAMESLKPESVKYAESIGREVRRQGDICAVPLPTLTLTQLKRGGGVYEKRGGLLGTNHQATEVVRVGRNTYARGTMRHVPENRRPDHKMLTLGKQWHLVVKNTVPVASSGRR